MTKSPMKKCEQEGCDELATYGIRMAVHCEMHVHPEESCLVQTRCVSCGLIDLVDEHGRCAYCDPQQYRRVRLAKQREVKVWLDQSSSLHHDYRLYDEMVEKGECGKERPDFAWDCGTHWVVLEVDEDQHKDRQEYCECARMVNISQSFGGLPVVFLRYNPDSYVYLDRSRHPSSSKRMKVVEEWLTHVRESVPEHYLSFVKLFFDGYDASTTTLEPVILSSSFSL